MGERQVIHSPEYSGGPGIRHVQILLQFFFYVIVFAIEMALSVSIPAMLNFDKDLQNLGMEDLGKMLSAYMVGFLITELFSPFLCKRYGVKWPMVILMGVTSAATLNFPMIANGYGASGIIFCRVLQGLCVGLLFSMPAEVISRWVPVRERTLLGTITYASGFLGQVLVSYARVYISNTMHHWSFLYTQLGYLSIIWVVLMAIFGADSPEQYPRKISESELDYIVNNRGNVIVKKKMKIPWGSLLTSMPFWAIVVAQIGAGWVLFVLVVNIPILMAFDFNVNKRGNIITLVTLITWVFSFVVAAIAQLLINKDKTTTGQSRKLFNTLGSCIPALLFLLLLFISGGNQYVGISIWVIMSASTVGTISGSKLNSNDITTNFAPVVYGISNWISGIFNIASLLFISFFLNMLDDWIFLFTYSAILAVVTNLFYIKFGSGEEQDWSNYEDVEDDEVDLSKSTSRASVDEGKYLLYVKKH